MIVIVSKYLTPKGYRGMTLFPFVIVKQREEVLDDVFVNHEKIHLRQQLELVIVFFYVFYFIEYLYRLAQYRNSKIAYRSISFEKEAFENEKDLSYLQRRPFWRFLNYV
jgi:hypothetical protein